MHHQSGSRVSEHAVVLDYDRKGFPYPVVPFQVNCYGRRVIAQQAGVRSLSESAREDDLDPPSPAPWRCFDLGAALRADRCRQPMAGGADRLVELVARLSDAKELPALPRCPGADRALYEALAARATTRSGASGRCRRIEDSGQQEMLNWMCLMGAMKELGRRPSETELVQTYIFNSSKCFAYFKP